MEQCNSLDERTGWAFVWMSSEWRWQYLVLTPGALNIYSNDHRSQHEKTLALARCVIVFQKPFSVSDSKAAKYGAKKRIWKSLLKFVSSDQSLSQTDIAVMTIKPRRGKTCYLMFPSQVEGEVWRSGVEEAAALGAANDTKAKPSRRSKALKQASDAIDQTRNFFQTRSHLKTPFGLRWEAYSPFFKFKEGKEQSSCSVMPSKEVANNSTEAESITMQPPKELWSDLESLHGCTEFLCSSYANMRALEYAALMVDHFKGSYQMGDSSLSDELRLEAWKGTARRIVQALVDQILSSNPSLEPCLTNDQLMDQLWAASEVWVFGAVHDKIMGACKQMFAAEDASLDRVLAKLEKVDPAKLGVRAEFEMLVLGEALDEFGMLNQLRTPYEKALCLRRTVMCIIDGVQRLIKSCSGALKDTEGLLPCTDDLLSFMLLLMARAKVKNLRANACYMESFINLQKDTNRGELVYHITNFIAACTYLQSSAVQELLIDVSPPPSSSKSHVHSSSHDWSSSSPSFSNGWSTSTDLEGSHRSHATATSSQMDSVDSDANSGSPHVSRLDGVLEKSSCFDSDAFGHWRSRHSFPGKETSSALHISDDPFSPNEAWSLDREGWLRAEASRGLFHYEGSDGTIGSSW